MFLTAVAHGLAACFVGFLDVAEASRILRLPEDTVCLYLLPVGYPADEPKEKTRRTVQEISFRNAYGIPVELPQVKPAEKADSSRTTCPAESTPSAAPSGNVTVRRAQPEDFQALYEMNELFNGPGTTTMELLADAIRHNNRETVLIAEAGGQHAGFCCVQFTSSMCYSTNYAEITELFVREEYRRQGVASALMAHAENCFKDQRVRSYQLFTGKTNTTAQHFYEQSGYVRSEELMYRKRL
ncbi:putative acetyltransferase [compost metagenome]